MLKNKTVKMPEDTERLIKQMLSLKDDEEIPPNILIAWSTAKRYYDRISGGRPFGPNELAIIAANAEMAMKVDTAKKMANEPLAEVPLEDKKTEYDDEELPEEE